MSCEQDNSNAPVILLITGITAALTIVSIVAMQTLALAGMDEIDQTQNINRGYPQLEALRSEQRANNDHLGLNDFDKKNFSVPIELAEEVVLKEYR